MFPSVPVFTGHVHVPFDSAAALFLQSQRDVFGRCLFVGHCRFRTKRRCCMNNRHTTKRACLVLLFTWFFSITTLPCRVWKPRYMSRKAMNIMVHIKYGNTVSDGTRARWESTHSHQGTQLTNLDEIVIPDSHAAVCLKAFEVSDGSIYWVFFLQPDFSSEQTAGHWRPCLGPCTSWQVTGVFTETDQRNKARPCPTRLRRVGGTNGWRR